MNIWRDWRIQHHALQHLTASAHMCACSWSGLHFIISMWHMGVIVMYCDFGVQGGIAEVEMEEETASVGSGDEEEHAPAATAVRSR